VQRLFK